MRTQVNPSFVSRSLKRPVIKIVDKNLTFNLQSQEIHHLALPTLEIGGIVGESSRTQKKTPKVNAQVKNLIGDQGWTALANNGSRRLVLRGRTL
jgi:hypothetical protein